MRLHAALFGVLLGLAPADGGAAPAVAGPAPAIDVESVRTAALHMHEERRYAEAAALLERLAVEAGRLDLLFDAGQSRFAAGHRAHALRLWRAYADSPGRDAEDIALASRRIAEARGLTTAITLVVHDHSDMSRVTLTLRRLHDPPDDERPALVIDALDREGAAHTAEIALDPGVWEVVAAPAASPPARREFTVGRAPQTVELVLASPAPPAPVTDAPPAVSRPRLGAGLVSLAATSLIAGTAVAVVAARGFDRRLGACAVAPIDPPCAETLLLADARRTGAGAGLVGAGVGLLAAAVTAFVPPRTPSGPRRAWVVEAITGGAALAAGAAWLAAENLAYAPGRAGDYLEWIGPWFDRRAVAASLLGAGAGLSLGAAAGLWPRRRSTWKPTLGRPGVGFMAAF